MQPSQSGNGLSAKRYITIILRLVVSGRGDIEHGEILDVDHTVHSPFIGWRGLTRTIRERLVRRD
jgi:hypothetical protein